MKKLTKKLLYTEYIIKRKSIRKIAKTIGLKYNTTRKQLIKYEISLRTRSEALMGHKWPEWVKKKIAKARLGYKVPKKVCEKMSKTRIEQGTFKGKNNPNWGKFREKNPNWKDGASFEPYGLEFDSSLREQVRFREKYKCKLCDCSQLENGQQLEVHHIDYDKKNNNLNNLVALCIHCHRKTNGNRKHWTKYFVELLSKEKVWEREKKKED